MITALIFIVQKYYFEVIKWKNIYQKFYDQKQQKCNLISTLAKTELIQNQVQNKSKDQS